MCPKEIQEKPWLRFDFHGQPYLFKLQHTDEKLNLMEGQRMKKKQQRTAPKHDVPHKTGGVSVVTDLRTNYAANLDLYMYESDPSCVITTN